MAKIATLTLCKIETREQIDTQFVRIEYVHEGTPVTNLVLYHSRVTSGQTCEIYLFVRLFIYFFIFFSDQRREEIPGRILTLSDSKDPKSRKGFFGL